MRKNMSLLGKILFTNRCILCGDVIELDDEFCEECKNPPVISLPVCESCGCSKEDCCCKKHKNEYKAIAAPFYYEDKITASVNRLKEQDMPQLADYLGECIADTVSKSFNDVKFDYITFVPLGELKKMRRGYNQAELLARAVAKINSIEISEILYKRRYTKTLHKSNSGINRKTLVFGAFDVYEESKKDIFGKTILLIDDVKTTGATLNECAKMMKIYGAEAVYCATAAITKGRDK